MQPNLSVCGAHTGVTLQGVNSGEQFPALAALILAELQVNGSVVNFVVIASLIAIELAAAKQALNVPLPLDGQETCSGKMGSNGGEVVLEGEKREKM